MFFTFNEELKANFRNDNVMLFNDNCLEVMKEIPDKSIDLILCDLPYNTTQRTTTHNKWDVPIDLKKLWEQYNRIIKDNGAIVLFGNEVFSSELINSNRNIFKYKWYWNKKRGNNFINARFMPMKCIEEICVFYKHTPTYNPQYWYSTPYQTTDSIRSKCHTGLSGGKAPTFRTATVSDDGRRYPLSLLTFKKENSNYHQAQKPTALLEYIIKTYTDENMVVLDNCMGSGSTGVACLKTGRKFIGIEIDKNFFDVAVDRIKEVE